MAMTYRDRIAGSTSIHAAMCVLGEAIDKLLEQDAPGITTSEWEAWQAQPTSALPAPAPKSDAEIEALRAELELTTGEDRLALEARLRLLEDDGTVPANPVPEGRRIITTANDNEITVDLPEADPARQHARYDFAFNYALGGMLDPPLGDTEAADAYAKGGPMWLYLYDRDAVMSMPVDWRRQFVQDVEFDSPAQAHELARDILKSEDPQPVGGVPVGDGEWV